MKPRMGEEVRAENRSNTTHWSCSVPGGPNSPLKTLATVPKVTLGRGVTHTGGVNYEVSWHDSRLEEIALLNYATHNGYCSDN